MSDTEPEIQEISAPTAALKSAKPRRRPCPGFQLAFPPGQSPYTSYPFAAHKQHILPWSIYIPSTTTSSITLRSENCTNEARTESKPCSFCVNLNNHNIIMGIRHRALDGAHEFTPRSYLSIDQLLSALERKTRQVDSLRLNALVVARKVVVRDRHLDGWKRLAVAISTNHIPRIRSLIAAELNNRGSVYAILGKVDQAVQRNYRPRGYEYADFQRAFLIWKLGGACAADISYRTLGTPSLSATREHIGVQPLCASPGVPTVQELEYNLSVCFPTSKSSSELQQPQTLDFDRYDDVYDQPIVMGMSMMIDEIKIQERLRWDPRTNQILGVCREHGHKCSLEFRTIEHADAVLECLKRKTIHLASQVCSIYLVNYPHQRKD